MFVSRCEEGKSRGIRASKGLSDRAPFPPGHILHYPPRWKSDNPSVRAHRSTRTYTQTHACMQAITQKQGKLSLLSASVPFVRRQWTLALMSLCRRLLCKQIQIWWSHTVPCASAEAGGAHEAGSKIELLHFIFLKFWFRAKSKYLSEERKRNLWSLSTLINQRSKRHSRGGMHQYSTWTIHSSLVLHLNASYRIISGKVVPELIVQTRHSDQRTHKILPLLEMHKRALISVLHGSDSVGKLCDTSQQSWLFLSTSLSTDPSKYFRLLKRSPPL